MDIKINFTEIGDKIKDMAGKVKPFVEEHAPVVKEKIDEYAPIIKDKLEECGDKVKPLVDEYAPIVKDKIDEFSDKAIEAFDGAMEKVATKSGCTTSDITRDEFMLKGRFAKNGYDWWWHSFTGYNRVTGEEKAFFIEFFTCNPALAEDEPVFGQLPENQESGKQPSYVMVKCGAWGENAKQLHRFFPWKDVKVHGNAPFYIEAADCHCSEGRLAGSVTISEEEAAMHPEWMCDAGTMKWNLSVDKKIPYNVGYGASKPVREAEAFEMYWHAEGMKTEYSGVVEYEGEEYFIRPDDCYGYADKNWGSDFTSPWIWLSSNNIYSKKEGRRLDNSVFDIGGGKPCVGGIELADKLLGAMYYEGTEMEFNFSKVWMDPKVKFDCYETEDEVVWHVELQNSAYVMVTNIKCLKKDMLLINYEAPSGLKLHNRLWNGGNGEGTVKLYRKHDGKRYLVDELICKNVGCEYGVFEEPEEILA